jgi:hypothetical protein
MTELERRQDKKWRLLWRGGLEVGPEGYKLDGEQQFIIMWDGRIKAGWCTQASRLLPGSLSPCHPVLILSPYISLLPLPTDLR